MTKNILSFFLVKTCEFFAENSNNRSKHLENLGVAAGFRPIAPQNIMFFRLKSHSCMSQSITLNLSPKIHKKSQRHKKYHLRGGSPGSFSNICRCFSGLASLNLTIKHRCQNSWPKKILSFLGEDVRIFR